MVAVAHSVLAIAYHLLKTGRPYAELGADYFDQLDAARAARHVKRLNASGCGVTLTPLPPAEPVRACWNGDLRRKPPAPLAGATSGEIASRQIARCGALFSTRPALMSGCQ